MGEYHDLYLTSDVLLLADVFESFRKMCLRHYQLDPPHYFTSPGLAWDAMLKMTKIELELMSDVDMFQFIEKGMRGGVSYIANRYAKANNKYMKNYDDKLESIYIPYLDANNLYGWAMSQPLPYGKFKWLTPDKIELLENACGVQSTPRSTEECVDQYATDKFGYILEVDLEYPEELHDLHNDYPLAPTKVNTSDLVLSDYCNKIINKLELKRGNYEKLTPTLHNKTKYVVHYKNLALYQRLGLKVTKIHRV